MTGKILNFLFDRDKYGRIQVHGAEIILLAVIAVGVWR